MMMRSAAWPPGRCSSRPGSLTAYDGGCRHLSATTVRPLSLRRGAGHSWAVVHLRSLSRNGDEDAGWLGGLVFLVAIILSDYRLVVGALPFWAAFRQRRDVRAAMAGANACVVGIMLSALYDPIITSAIHSRADFGLALAAFGLLVQATWSPLVVVVLAAARGWLLAIA